jgi:hypothetical protein
LLINLLLFNNLNKYHPFFLYLSFSFFSFIQFFCVNYLLERSICHPIYFLKKIKKYLLALLVCSAFSLFLGSWWAQQEGSWGGWWNWDPSENLGLIAFLLSLMFIHLNFKKLCFLKFNTVWFFFFSFFLFLFVYLFLQLNFELVSHNFGLKFFFFFNNNFLFFEASLCSIVLLIALSLQLYSQKSRFLFFLPESRFFFFFFNYVFLYFTLLYCLLTLAPLSAYFFWSFFSLSMLNLEVNVALLSCFFFFIFFF